MESYMPTETELRQLGASEGFIRVYTANTPTSDNYIQQVFEDQYGRTLINDIRNGKRNNFPLHTMDTFFQQLWNLNQYPTTKDALVYRTADPSNKQLLEQTGVIR